MKSWETIDRTIKFGGPERLGMHYFIDGKWDSDIFLSSAELPKYDEKRRIENNFELWRDVWGNTIGRVANDKTTKGEIVKGVLENWDDLDNYELPDLAEGSLYDALTQQFIAHKDMYKLAGIPGWCFDITRKLRRLENFLADIKLERARVIELISRVEELLTEMICQCAKSGADGIFFGEDWGTQNQLLISPSDWLCLFMPCFERLCNVAAKNHMTVWMHSCGYIYEIIPHLIKSGVHVLQLDQPELMGIERLGNEFGGQVTFWSPCDIQKIMPTRDKALIENSIRRMCEKWFVAGGGLIAKSYGTSNKDLESIGVDPDTSKFAYNCFVKYGGIVTRNCLID
jgi:uroporphyrinogen decarboxylase